MQCRLRLPRRKTALHRQADPCNEVRCLDFLFLLLRSFQKHHFLVLFIPCTLTNVYLHYLCAGRRSIGSRSPSTRSNTLRNVPQSSTNHRRRSASTRSKTPSVTPSVTPSIQLPFQGTDFLQRQVLWQQISKQVRGFSLLFLNTGESATILRKSPMSAVFVPHIVPVMPLFSLRRTLRSFDQRTSAN